MDLKIKHANFTDEPQFEACGSRTDRSHTETSDEDTVKFCKYL